MKRLLFVALTVIAVTALTFSVAAAGNPFGKETSTVKGYSTWDSDLINVEKVSQTGQGVYVAVLDTGLMPNWADYFPKARIRTDLGTGFEQPVTFKVGKNPCEFDTYKGQLRQSTWVGSLGSTHGTHVTSTIIGYSYRSNSDASQGYPLPPIQVRGIAPEVSIIPVKVLADYTIPALPKCGLAKQSVVFGTDEMVAAGINYVTKLADAGYKPIVINMSLGGSELADIEKAAIDKAVDHGVIIVAAAGNAGEAGMDYPGAYAPVISAGSAGWTGEWLNPGTVPDPANRYRMFWLQYPNLPVLPGTGDVADPTSVDDVYVSDFSSRQLSGTDQQLDVLAPGSWVRGPFAGDPGYNHLPWWSKGIADLLGHNSGNFYYAGGTSMATPHVAATAALLLQENPTLNQAQIESILKATALSIPASGSQTILDNSVVVDVPWDTDCGDATTPLACNAVGSGLIQVDAAINAVP